MKKIQISLILILSSVIVYSQDNINDLYENLMEEKVKISYDFKIEKDSIIKFFENEKALNDNSIAISNQTIVKLNKEKENLALKISSLKKDTASLKRVIKKLGKHNVQELELQLKEMNDSIDKKNIEINNLKAIVGDKNLKLNELKIKCEDEKNKVFVEGEKIVKDKLNNFYLTKSFDELVMVTSPEILNRDIMFLGKNFEKAVARIKKIQVFFSVQKLLANKFDKTKVQVGIEKLDAINEKSTSISNTKSILKNYEIKNEGLKDVFKAIIELDATFIVTFEEDKKIKHGDISYAISQFIKDYEFNFKNNSYLTNLLLEFINKKADNPDADVKHFIDKL